MNIDFARDKAILKLNGPCFGNGTCVAIELSSVPTISIPTSQPGRTLRGCQLPEACQRPQQRRRNLLQNHLLFVFDIAADYTSTATRGQSEKETSPQLPPATSPAPAANGTNRNIVLNRPDANLQPLDRLLVTLAPQHAEAIKLQLSTRHRRPYLSVPQLLLLNGLMATGLLRHLCLTTNRMKSTI
jgi:hypothetical protein